MTRVDVAKEEEKAIERPEQLNSDRLNAPT